jgi:MATE family multidrug resistance protein
VVANWAFIHGIPGFIPAMGAVGPGWASTAVRWTMCLTGLLCLVWQRDGQPFRWTDVGPDRKILGDLVRLGVPIGVQAGLEVGLFAFAAVMMGWLGPLALAAHQVAINIATTTFMVAFGLSTAGAIRIGQHLGAGDPERVRHAAVAVYVLTMAFMSACACFFIALPAALIGLYTPVPDVIVLGGRLLFVAAVYQLFDGAQVAAAGILRGAGETRVTMHAGAFGFWLVGMPIAYGLGFHSPLGPVGVWIGLYTGVAVVAVLLGWRVYTVLRHPPVLATSSG